MIKVVIAEDHTVVAEGFKSLLNGVEEISILKIVENGRMLLEYLQHNNVDIVIMDVMMPEMDGLEATAIIKEKYSHVKVLMLSISHKGLHIQGAIDAGADGYLLKETTKEELIKAINELMDGKTFYGQKVTGHLIDSSINSTSKIKLTNREFEVLKLLCDGETNKEISQILHIGTSTVKTYRDSLLKKFDAKNSVHLVKKAIEAGVI